jgi:hypothetical protein
MAAATAPPASAAPQPFILPPHKLGVYGSPPVAAPPVKLLDLSPGGGVNTMLPKYGSGSSSSWSGGIATANHFETTTTPWASSGEDGGLQLPLSVPPTAASLAAAAATHTPGAFYRDSASFGRWATTASEAAAAHNGSSGGGDMRPHHVTGAATPGASPMSPATAADLAAAMPPSPISYPIFTEPSRHNSGGNRNGLAHHRGSHELREVASAAELGVLKQMLEAYQRQQQAQLQMSGGASPVAAAGWAHHRALESRRVMTRDAYARQHEQQQQRQH